MMIKKSLAFLLFLLVMVAGAAFANKTSVAIEAPSSVEAGTEITIVVNVRHRGNNAFHHTKWVSVKADGEEIAKWEFTGSKRPENENFSREVKYTVTKPVEITAQGSCSVHGSQGPVTVKIDVK